MSSRNSVFEWIFALIIHSVGHNSISSWGVNRTMLMDFAYNITGLEPVFCSFTKDLYYCYFLLYYISSFVLFQLIKPKLRFKEVIT